MPVTIQTGSSRAAGNQPMAMARRSPDRSPTPSTPMNTMAKSG